MDRARDPAERWASRALAAAVASGLLWWAFSSDPVWFDRHFLADYCAESRRALVWEQVSRVVGVVVGAVVLWRLPRLDGRWLRWHRTSELRKLAAGVVVAALGGLVVSDIALRVVARRHHVENEPAMPPMREDETGNYVPVPLHTKDVKRGNRLTRYAIDAAGNRASSAAHVDDPNAPTILFAGESISLGCGVAYEDAFPTLVGAALGVQPVNLSVARSATDQNYRRLEAALPTFSRVAAVVSMVLPCALQRSVSPNRERLALLDADRLQLIPRGSVLETSPLLKLVPLHSDEAIPLTAAILRATTALASARGARAFFVFANFGPMCTADERGTSWLERKLFEDNAAPHVRIDLTPELVIGAPDLHPNEKGHRVFADAVARMLRKGGVGVATDAATPRDARNQ